MKIVILGAGQVGGSVAESLVSEDNEITVVDLDPARLRRLQERLDLRVVTGNAALPSVLAQAGTDDADLLLAVTQSDQTNLCACRTAATLFNTPIKIARLRAADYDAWPQLLDHANFAVDHSICPEQLVCDTIVRLIEFPEALQVLEFADGLVSLVAVRAVPGGAMVGHEVAALHQRLPRLDARIAAIWRRDQPIVPRGDSLIEAGDEVFFLAATGHIREVLRELRHRDRPTRRILIAGGGNIGERLLANVPGRVQVRLIEVNEERAKTLGARYADALVLVGEAADEALLRAEGVADTDLFLALTDDDENNILSALLAKALGARRVLALINRRAYVNLLQDERIDIVIAPAEASLGALLAHVRRGDVKAVHSLRRGAAEALEIVVHGDRGNSRVVGRRVGELDLPAGVTLGALVRGPRPGPGAPDRREVLIAHDDTLIEAEDHLILFLVSKSLVRRVERLFQVGVGFL